MLTGVACFEAAVADQVAPVVGELEHAQAELLEQVDTREVLGDRRRILESVDQTEAPAALGERKVVGAAHEQQMIGMRRDLCVPVGDVADGLVVVAGIAADSADRDIDRGKARRAHVGKRLRAERRVRFGVVFARPAECVNDDRLVVAAPRACTLAGGEHGRA